MKVHIEEILYIYECDFCGSLKRNITSMKKHEVLCKKNPINKKVKKHHKHLNRENKDKKNVIKNGTKIIKLEKENL